MLHDLSIVYQSGVCNPYTMPCRSGTCIQTLSAEWHGHYEDDTLRRDTLTNSKINEKLAVCEARCQRSFGSS
jgi:hypothetical protein